MQSGESRGTHQVPHSGVLGQNGDPPLALQVIGVHDSLVHDLVVAEHLALPQHGIHQGGLAMIDVGNDGNVSDLQISICIGPRL